jgi:hypothetical protein
MNAAVEAVAEEAKRPEREEPVEAALRSLAGGDATEAKAVLAGIVERKATEGVLALKEAAAARHLGTLAMLDNTLEALSAFRRAAELDPADTWTWIHISRLEVQRGEWAPPGLRPAEPGRRPGRHKTREALRRPMTNWATCWPNNLTARSPPMRRRGRSASGWPPPIRPMPAGSGTCR